MKPVQIKPKRLHAAAVVDSDVEVEDTEDVTAPGNAHPPRSAAPIKQHASTLEDDSSKEQGLGDDEWKDDDGEDAAEPRNAYVDFESESVTFEGSGYRSKQSASRPLHFRSKPINSRSLSVTSAFTHGDPPRTSSDGPEETDDVDFIADGDRQHASHTEQSEDEDLQYALRRGSPTKDPPHKLTANQQ
ncbi:hypothetical protein C8Q72DRAFT_542837 [Fomitopsis betulina]|nr:hypothetical protein C8Q72DRAFT_542837 [Fomitopsis betulina]